MTKNSAHKPGLMLPMLGAFPESARIVDVRTGLVLTRDELAGKIRRTAAAIASQTVGREGPVVVAEPDAPRMIETLFAAWAAGRAAVVVNPGLSGPEQKNVIAHTGAVAWYGQLRCGFENHAVTGVVPANPLGPDEPALILMTSGTTGIPKGIVQTLRSLSARIALNIVHIGRDDLACSLCVLPMYFGHGLIGNCLTPLAAGGSLHLWCSPQIAELPGLAGMIDRYRVTFMSSVPSFWKLAARMSASPQNAPARIHVGSAPLSIGQWNAIAQWAGTDNVYNMFGMTETANWIGGGPLREARGRDGYAGIIWGGRYAVCDEHGNFRQQGKGEVLVQSPSIMQAYLNAPEKTAEAFIGDWFRTGDIGEIDALGAITLVGRIKSEINRAGIKIQAEEIDMLLERHPAVEEACAFGIPDAASGEAVAAAIVLSPDAEEGPQQIRQWCRDQVRVEAVPAVLHVMESIPRNDRGKVVRSIVRAAVGQSEAT
ncbi:MAG: acyl--CoA ligase [Hyphomicrobiales bacterium]|nr:acyl--CoA ligase [Hyphomicrobiales bacterium]MCP5001915.1 acyl--CoA ligase [Hyphomicrobiales bacterium]